MNNSARRKFLKHGVTSSLAVALGPQLFGAEQGGRIRIGQIGTKHGHARGKLATMQKMKDHFEIVGVVEPDNEQKLRVRNEAEYRDVRWMTEPELLATPGLQAVAIETDVKQLVPTAKRCVDAGLHIHLDKPAGESLGPFRDVLDTAARQNRIVQMGYMFRYNPAFQFAFNAARRGWLGNIFEVHGVISKMINDDDRRALSPYAGGSMFELGCHLIDALHVVMGRPDKVTAFPRQTRPDNLRDNCLAVFEYPKATATIRSALVEVDGFKRRQFVVCGDEGTMDIRPLEPGGKDANVILSLARPRGEYKAGRHELHIPRPGGRYDGDFIDLASIIRGEKKADFGPDHDLAVQQSVLLASGIPL